MSGPKLNTPQLSATQLCFGRVVSGSTAGFGCSSPLLSTLGMPPYQSRGRGLGFCLQVLPLLVVLAAGGLSEESDGVGTLSYPMRRVGWVFVRIRAPSLTSPALSMASTPSVEPMLPSVQACLPLALTSQRTTGGDRHRTWLSRQIFVLKFWRLFLAKKRRQTNASQHWNAVRGRWQHG